MPQKNEFVAEIRDGAIGWLHVDTGWWMPIIAGAEDPPADDPPPDDPPKDDDPPADDPPDDAAALRAENQRLKREAAAREKDKRQAEKAAKDASDARAAEQGEWKKLAEERSSRIGELEGQLAERDLRDAQREQRQTVEAVADRLNFRRPKRAYALLVDELGAEKATETLADEQLTEAALKRLSKAEPELVDTTRRTGAPVNGARRGGEPDASRDLNQTLASLLGATPNT